MYLFELYTDKINNCAVLIDIHTHAHAHTLIISEQQAYETQI